MPSKIDQYGKT